MTNVIRPLVFDGIVYPESDGKPIGDNSLQFKWIVTINSGMEDRFMEEPNVAVHGDLLWYPVQGDNKIRLAPDAMVIFGRPKGYRGAYLQWLEGNIPPQVVFEVLSPSNTKPEMTRKRKWYEKYGVEEFYIYDPDRGLLEGWMREEGELKPVKEMRGWISPRLKLRFELSGKDLELYTNGDRILSYQELANRKRAVEKRADQERLRAEQAEIEAQQERLKREQETLAKERAWAKLRELGIDPEKL